MRTADCSAKLVLLYGVPVKPNQISDILLIWSASVFPHKYPHSTFRVNQLIRYSQGRHYAAENIGSILLVMRGKSYDTLNYWPGVWQFLIVSIYYDLANDESSGRDVK